MRERVRTKPSSVRGVPEPLSATERKPAWLGYIVAFLTVLILTAILDALRPVFPGVLILTPYLLLTMGIAYYFGFGPALLSVVLTAFGQAYVYDQPIHRIWPVADSAGEWARLLFLEVSTIAAAGAMLAVKRLTARLVREHSLLDQVLTATPDHIYMYDREGRYVFVSRSGSAVLGIEPERMLGRTWRELGFPTEVMEPLERRIGDVFSTGEAITGETHFPTMLGEREYEYSLTPVRDGGRRVYAVVATVRDVTERKRAQETLEKEKERLAALEEVSSIGIMARSLDELLEEVVGRIANVLDVERASVFIYDDMANEFEIRAAHGLRGAVGNRIVANDNLAGVMIRERRLMVVRDAEHNNLVIDPMVRAEGFKTLVAAPLIARGQLVGMVRAYAKEDREFPAEEISMLQLIAERTALVIENAQLVEELQRHLSMLQKALLPPSPPVVPGYDIATAYQPGARGAEIGGDFYDVFETEDGDLAIVIGDVTGKGIPSASLAAATRSTVHAFAYDTSDPAASLTHAAAVQYRKDPEDMLFVTVFLAVIDLNEKCIRYSNAGHPPAAIYHAESGEVTFLSYGDPPVGPAEAYTYRQWEQSLGERDKIVFYTDGVSEARRGREMFGEERVREVIREFGSRPPHDLVSALISAATSWAQGHLADDCAVIVLECEQATP